MVRPRPAGKVLTPAATDTATAAGETKAPTTPPPASTYLNDLEHDLRDRVRQQYAPVNKRDLPDGAVLSDDHTILFKQTGDLFKQIQDPSGAVVGLMYKGPRMAAWSTLSRSQVKSRLGIYQTRADAGEVSDAVRKGLEVWEWAFGLFHTHERVVQHDISTIHHDQQ